ncbi:MAG: hypothetical protein IJ830_01240 [Alphaproteobacteria bacterium]|nr:hypothetical protein [Alphaproteobacteria bacterium]
MTEDNDFLDEFVFYINDDQVAVSINNIDINAEKAIYDGKNILYLKTPEDKSYALQNIVPEVRSILKKSNELTIILLKDQEFVDAYELELKIDETLSEEDVFSDEAGKFYLHFADKK